MGVIPNIIVICNATQSVHCIEVDVRGMSPERFKFLGMDALGKVRHTAGLEGIKVGEFASGQLWEDLWNYSMKDGDIKYCEHIYIRTTCTLGGIGIGKGCPFTSFKRVA